MGSVESTKLRPDELYLNLTAYILQANEARPGMQALTTATAVEIGSIATSIALQTTTATSDAGGRDERGAAPAPPR